MKPEKSRLRIYDGGRVVTLGPFEIRDIEEILIDDLSLKTLLESHKILRKLLKMGMIASGVLDDTKPRAPIDDDYKGADGPGCFSCKNGLCPRKDGGFLPCTFCGRTGAEGGGNLDEQIHRELDDEYKGGDKATDVGGGKPLPSGGP